MNKADRPIFIISCNRSGSTLLFNNLSSHPVLWSEYIESQKLYYQYFPVDPRRGDELDENDATSDVSNAIQEGLIDRCNNKEYFRDLPLIGMHPAKAVRPWMRKFYKPEKIRIVEKTPANSFRVRFIKKIFQDAKFLFLVRRGEDAISSLIEGWEIWSKSGGGKWVYDKWHYLVPPEWQTMRDKSLQEICAFQWQQSTIKAWKDLNEVCSGQFKLFRHEDLMDSPMEKYSEILEFCELPQSKHFEKNILNITNRIFTTGGSLPKKEKWKKLHYNEIIQLKDIIEPVNRLFYK